MRPTVHVAQWFTNGDHPHDRVGATEIDWPATLADHPELVGHDGPIPQIDDARTYARVEGAVVRFWRRPDVPGSTECTTCGWTMHDHGWIDSGGDGQTVCPGDLIATMNYETYQVTSPEMLRAELEKPDVTLDEAYERAIKDAASSARDHALRIEAAKLRIVEARRAAGVQR